MHDMPPPKTYAFVSIRLLQQFVVRCQRLLLKTQKLQIVYNAAARVVT